MKRTNSQRYSGRFTINPLLLGAATAPLLLGGVVAGAWATEPCNDEDNFGECKALIEINASDGDIGFHWLIDGDDLNSTRMDDPNGKKVYENKAFGPLRDQKLTETFGESAEPLCFVPLPEDQDEDFDEEDVVTLAEFLERWAAGPYTVSGSADGGEKLFGMTELTYMIPAAPSDVGIDDNDASVVEWAPGDDLGKCATSQELQALVGAGVLPRHPQSVMVDSYEVVVEPDVDEDEPNAALINSRVFSARVPGSVTSLTVSQEYLLALGDGTPVKLEVGAIGGEDNATFTEEDGFCVVVENGDASIEECEEED